MTDNKRTIINHLLVDLFNHILHIEEKALKTGPFQNLSISELHVIEAIGMDQTLPMSSIASRLDVTVGTLTVSMTNLVKKGYVIRERSEVDRRVVLIQLSELGKEAFRHHERFHREMIEYTVAVLSEKESDVLVDVLSKLTDYFNRKYK